MSGGCKAAPELWVLWPLIVLPLGTTITCVLNPWFLWFSLFPMMSASPAVKPLVLGSLSRFCEFPLFSWKKRIAKHRFGRFRNSWPVCAWHSLRGCTGFCQFMMRPVRSAQLRESFLDVLFISLFRRHLNQHQPKGNNSSSSSSNNNNNSNTHTHTSDATAWLR